MVEVHLVVWLATSPSNGQVAEMSLKELIVNPNVKCWKRTDPCVLEQPRENRNGSRLGEFSVEWP